MASFNNQLTKTLKISQVTGKPVQASFSTPLTTVHNPGLNEGEKECKQTKAWSRKPSTCRAQFIYLYI